MPALIIHGGAGPARNKDGCREITLVLARIADLCWTQIQAGESAIDIVTRAAVELENNPLFNAGFGSKLQKDGAARLSAALMDGQRERFSGVVNVEGILNPILLCAHLQDERDRVLCGDGAREKARSIGLEEGNVRSPKAIDAWKKACEGETGTIGAVVVDKEGRIAVATSTGGRGMEGPGRVSDSCTVAGNYATTAAGVSCTGIGEDIVDGALAVRLVTAVEAGLDIDSAAKTLQNQMLKMQWRAGLIGLDTSGKWIAIHTTDIMYWYAIDPTGHQHFTHPDDQ